MSRPRAFVERSFVAKNPKASLEVVTKKGVEAVSIYNAIAKRRFFFVHVYSTHSQRFQKKGGLRKGTKLGVTDGDNGK